MKYKMSIILPVFNVEKYIRDCLASLKRQSIGFENLEIIFVDDCSTDSSAEILDEFEKCYNNINVYSTKKNSGGAGTPRNVGLEHVNSEYVLFLDPDDTLYDNACEVLSEKIEKTNADVISGIHSIKYEDSINPNDMLIYNSFTDPNDSWSKREEKVKKIFETEKYEIEFNNIDEIPTFIGNYGLASKAFRVQFINQHNIRFPEKIPGEDSVFLFDSLLYAKKIVFIKEFIYSYTKFRQDDNSKSITLQYDLEKNLGRLEAYKLMLETSKKTKKLFYYLQYYLPNKLNYFMTTFIINKDIPLEDLEILFEYSTELFELTLNNSKNLSNELKIIYQNIVKKDYKRVLKLCQKDIPKNPQTIHNLRDINVAVILDPLSYNSYSAEFNAFVLEPYDWLDIFENNKIDLFFCESGWDGGIEKKNIINGIARENISSPWKDKIVNCSKDKERTLLNVLDYCKENNIPTIFWNKEDPKSFNSFIDTALHFDYIFTTDQNSVHKYMNRGHENVDVLLFASQIKLYNPISYKNRSNDIIFAGSWYNSYPKRCKTMTKFFETILNSGYNLKIYNRHSKRAEEMPHWRFPEKYQKFENPGVPSDKMADVYKESKFALNINSIVNSPTMFARRVFELMSSNTFVISNYSEGVENLFGNNVLFLDDKTSLELDNTESIEKICEKNLYDVLENHTYSERWKYILKTIGFKYMEKKESVSIFYSKNEVYDIKRIIDDFNKIPYSNKKCVIITNNKKLLNQTTDKNIYYISPYDLETTNIEEDYFIFRDIYSPIDKHFIKKALLHYKYIEDNIGITLNTPKYTFSETTEIKDILFNKKSFNCVKDNFINNKKNKLKIYNI